MANQSGGPFVLDFENGQQVEDILKKAQNIANIRTIGDGLLLDGQGELSSDTYTKAEIDAMIVGSTVDTQVLPDSTNPVQNKAIYSFVNSSVATNTASFQGTYHSLAELEAVQNPTNNDYGFVINVQSVILLDAEPADWSTNWSDYYALSGGEYVPVGGSTAPTFEQNTYYKADGVVYKRYKYNAGAVQWEFEYDLNNSSFTAAEWATIQSGFTAADKAKYDGYEELINSKPGLVETTSGNVGEIFNSYSGEGKNTASGNYSHAEGKNTTASGNYSHAEGHSSTATADYAHAEGSSHADGYYAHAEGTSSTASGSYSHSEGENTKASNSSSHAEGFYTTASGVQAHAEGNTTTAYGAQSHAEGLQTQAMGPYSHAEGHYSIAGNPAAHAEGTFAIASGENSHAEGFYTIAQRKSQHVEGEYNVPDPDGASYIRGKFAHIIGNGTADDARSNAYAIDWEGKIYQPSDPNADSNGVFLSSKADKATTLSGYGITDAKIQSGTITLGSQTITPITQIPIASSSVLGGVKIGSGISVASDGTISASGSGGTSDYSELSNKPQINSTTLTGNKSSSDLGLQSAITSSAKLSADVVDDTSTTHKFVTDSDKATWSGKQDAISNLETIRNGADAGATAVQTIKINGTTQTKTDGTVNLPAYPTKSSLGLGNVDNTSDLAKPISTAVQADQQRQDEEIAVIANAGAKSLLPIGVSSITYANAVSFSVANDGIITVNGTNPNSYAGIPYADLVEAKSSQTETRYTLPAGKYKITSTGDGLKFQVHCHNGTDTSALFSGKSGGEFEYTSELKAQYPYICWRLAIDANASFSNQIVKPMIWNAEIKDSTFQPYAPTNRELYEMILALQNGGA